MSLVHHGKRTNKRAPLYDCLRDPRPLPFANEPRLKGEPLHCAALLQTSQNHLPIGGGAEWDKGQRNRFPVLCFFPSTYPHQPGKSNSHCPEKARETHSPAQACQITTSTPLPLPLPLPLRESQAERVKIQSFPLSTIPRFFFIQFNTRKSPSPKSHSTSYFSISAYFIFSSPSHQPSSLLTIHLKDRLSKQRSAASPWGFLIHSDTFSDFRQQ